MQGQRNVLIAACAVNDKGYIYVKVAHIKLFMLRLKVLFGDENALYVTVCQRVLVDYILALPITPACALLTAEEVLVDLLAVGLGDQPGEKLARYNLITSHSSQSSIVSLCLSLIHI